MCTRLILDAYDVSIITIIIIYESINLRDEIKFSNNQAKYPLFVYSRMFGNHYIGLLLTESQTSAGCVHCEISSGKATISLLKHVEIIIDYGRYLGTYNA